MTEAGSSNAPTGPVDADAPSDWADQHLGPVVVPEARLQGRITELGQEITRDYASRAPLLVDSRCKAAIVGAIIALVAVIALGSAFGSF